MGKRIKKTGVWCICFLLSTALFSRQADWQSVKTADFCEDSFLRHNLSARLNIADLSLRVAFSPSQTAPLDMVIKSLPLEHQGAVIDTQENIIAPDNLASGALFADFVRIIIDSVYPENSQKELCNRVLITAAAILTSDEYAPYLNDKGRMIREEVLALYTDFKRPEFEWSKENFKRLKSLLNFVPTLKNPNEELFVDVFEDISDTQLEIIMSSGINGIWFALELTRNCPHNCVICEFWSPAGRLKHMPFPLVSKLIKRLTAIQKEKSSTIIRFAPYFRSDPFVYHDRVINAAISDVVNLAFSNGCEVSFLTHGTEGVLLEKNNLQKIMRDLQTPFEFSFHAFHDDIKDYALKKARGELNEEEIHDIFRTLTDDYVRKYAEFLDSAINSGKLLQIRRYEFYSDELESALEEAYSKRSGNVDFAKAVLHEMSIFQQAIFYACRNKILQRSQKDIFNFVEKDKQGKEIFMPIVWNGRAAKLLEDIGLSRETIADIKLRQKNRSIVFNDYLLFVDSAGRVLLQTKENETVLFRRVKQMFAADTAKFFGILAVCK